jgi:hypothetical protein
VRGGGGDREVPGSAKSWVEEVGKEGGGRRRGEVQVSQSPRSL